MGARDRAQVRVRRVRRSRRRAESGYKSDVLSHSANKFHRDPEEDGAICFHLVSKGQRVARG